MPKDDDDHLFQMIDVMQLRFKQRGQDSMVMKDRSREEVARIGAKLDTTFQQNETRLQVADGTRPDLRAKKRERRTGQADNRKDKAERRRQDRRGASRIL